MNASLKQLKLINELILLFFFAFLVIGFILVSMDYVLYGQIVLAMSVSSLFLYVIGVLLRNTAKAIVEGLNGNL